jgi:excisionase family DNA binding protein
MSKIIVTTHDELEILIQTSVKKALSEQAPESNKPQSLLLNIDQASEFLNLAKQTLYGFTSRFQIPFIKRGKKLYFRHSELETWLNEGKRKTNKQIEAEINGKPL